MIAAAALALLAAACVPGGEKGLPPVGEAAVDQVHAQCIAGGGDFLRHENKKNFVCERVPRDAGKACQKASDCESACLARSHSCAPVVPLLGCNEVLTESGLAVTECVE